MDAEEARIAKILEVKEVPDVTEKYLLKYRKYLLQQLNFKEIFTGCEDFSWEEKYVFGGFSQSEYERLKKINPSHTDEYELIDILEDMIDDNDLAARVKRVSDGKIFEVGLSWLSAKNEDSKDYQLLDDYATWVVNWN